MSMLLGVKQKKLYHCKDCELVCNRYLCPKCHKDIRKSKITYLESK